MTTGRRVLVTGAGGALGGHLTGLLSNRGDQVFAVLRRGRPATLKMPSGIEQVACDLVDFDQVQAMLSRTRPDAIVHCAGRRAGAALHELLSANVLGLSHLLDAASGTPVRFLAVGSSAEYAPAADGHAITETDPLEPATPYGLSKLLQYRVSQFAAVHGTPVVYLRPFNMVGPGVSADTALADFARKLAGIDPQARNPVIETGNLDLERDFTDVRDVAAACIVLMDRGTPGTAYNVCSGITTRLGDALEVLRRLAGRPVEIRSEPQPYGMRSQRGNASRLRGLGWTPAFTLEQSLADALAWWRSPETRCL
jgi:GDP-4-dehydro-6-deoxy-D-mannose reductase